MERVIISQQQRLKEGLKKKGKDDLNLRDTLDVGGGGNVNVSEVELSLQAMPSPAAWQGRVGSNAET